MKMHVGAGMVLELGRVLSSLSPMTTGENKDLVALVSMAVVIHAEI